MRYLPEIPWGRFTEDSSRFEFGRRNRATETGSPNDLRCDHDPWQDMGHMSEASAILVAAAMHQAA
jgi:hypothetical protein